MKFKIKSSTGKIATIRVPNDAAIEDIHRLFTDEYLTYAERAEMDVIGTLTTYLISIGFTIVEVINDDPHDWRENAE